MKEWTPLKTIGMPAKLPVLPNCGLYPLAFLTKQMPTQQKCCSGVSYQGNVTLSYDIEFPGWKTQLTSDWLQHVTWSCRDPQNVGAIFSDSAFAKAGNKTSTDISEIFVCLRDSLQPIWCQLGFQLIAAQRMLTSLLAGCKSCGEGKMQQVKIVSSLP